MNFESNKNLDSGKQPILLDEKDLRRVSKENLANARYGAALKRDRA